MMNLGTIKTLIDMVGRSGIDELTVAQNGVTVRIVRGAGRALDTPLDRHAHAQMQGPASAASANGNSSAPYPVEAPLSGLFHTCPDAASPPFVAPGDTVAEGQTIGLIEAMKVFTPVLAARSGTLQRLLVENGQDVDAGQALMELI
jgi:acetyl-CoA carboxylase biotin carboxyl carrier protein